MQPQGTNVEKGSDEDRALVEKGVGESKPNKGKGSRKGKGKER